MGEIPKHIWENDNFLKKLKSAVEVERMSLDERLAYELSLSVERDWYACMEYRYEEGVEKGKQEGIEQGKQVGLEEGLMKGKQEEQYQIATNLKESGIDLQTIVSCTGLTLDRIECRCRFVQNNDFLSARKYTRNRNFLCLAARKNSTLSIKLLGYSRMNSSRQAFNLL